MDKKHVLVACPLFDDNYDLGGNKYLEKGEFIQASNFCRTPEIDDGLYGYLWGTSVFPLQRSILNGLWAVVKTEINENLILLDKTLNIVKFEKGIILHMGKIKSLANFIMSIKDDSQHYFADEVEKVTPKTLMGTKKWLSLYKT